MSASPASTLADYSPALARGSAGGESRGFFPDTALRIICVSAESGSLLYPIPANLLVVSEPLGNRNKTRLSPVPLTCFQELPPCSY